MQRRNYDFEEKTLLGNFNWQKTHFAKHECDVFFWNMSRCTIIAEWLLVLTVELKFQLFNRRYNVIIISEHCSQELKDTHL